MEDGVEDQCLKDDFRSLRQDHFVKLKMSPM